MQHLDGLCRPTPRLPSRGTESFAARLLVSILLHAAGVVGLVVLVPRAPVEPTPALAVRTAQPTRISSFVFIARDVPEPGGGGGGGNRQRGPIRHAEGKGHDGVTLRIARSSLQATSDIAAPPRVAEIVLDARPLASGTQDIRGLPEGGVSFGTSTGPGTGGGVGDGAGTGIGSGIGAGVGPGSGGGIGGGVYRPGGSVTPPRILTQVKPKYTIEALGQKIQGSVILEMIVTREGRPAAITVIRSLDPGLDDAAVRAASAWRFDPGRLAGTPVDVLVTLMLDFRIQ